MRKLKLAFVAAAAALLTGCGTALELDKLKNAEPKGSAFNKALTGQYLDLAEFESKEMDWIDARNHAKKGLRAAAGEEVLPEDPNDWRIGKANMTDAESDRKILVGLLGKGGRENTPGTAAKAQASYDCWLEQLEEGWQIEHIEACRQGFLAAVAKMLSARAAMAPPPASKPMMAAAPAKPAPKPMAPKPATFTVYFYYDSAGLNPNFAPVLRKILGAARKRGMGLKIDIVGYTDTAGSAKYNQKLSLERANTVSRGLGRLGMPTGPMTVAGRGETELKIKTKDGVQEPGNRRVVITVR